MPDTFQLQAASLPHENQGSSRFQWIMPVLILYYWLLQLTTGDSVALIPAISAYYIYVIPAILFGSVGVIAILSARKIEKSTACLIIFIALLILVSLYRGDYRSIFNVGLFSITIATILQIRPSISINYINILFCFAAIITTFLFFLGYSIYTFVPGIGLNADLWWRISPYPSVAEGALFATFVLILNIILTGQAYRRAMIALSSYFVLLSGNRTALIATIAASSYIFLYRRGVLRRRSAQAIFVIAIIFLLVTLIYGSQILLSSPLADNAVIRALILRDENVTGFDFGNQVGTAAIRQWIFDQHIAAFQESPLIGIGTFDLSMLNSGYGALDNNVSGTEAFVTGMIARIGLLSVPLFLAIFVVPQRGQYGPRDVTNAVRIALLIGMTTYGSFVNAYDVVFVLMIVAIAGGIYVPFQADKGGRRPVSPPSGAMRA